MQTFVVGSVSAKQNESGRTENFTFCHIFQHKYLGCAVRIVLTMLNPFIKSENCFCVRSMTSCLSRGTEILRFANASRAEQNRLPPIQDPLLNVEYYRKTGIEYPSRMDQVQIAN